jgi:bifunctional DNase/RNase
VRDDDLVALTITDVRVAVPAGNGVEAGLVVLQEDEEPHRKLQMYVAQPEARAIHVSWSHGVPPRPSTWDLFISTISLLGARIDRVVINDVQEQRHYFAQLVVYHADNDEPHIVTARPSDALALALRAYGATLFAHSHVLDEAGLLADGSHWVRPRPESEPEPDVPEEDVPLGGMIGGPREEQEPTADQPERTDDGSDDAERPSWLQQLEARAAGREVDPDAVAPAPHSARQKAAAKRAAAKKVAAKKVAAKKVAGSKSVAKIATKRAPAKKTAPATKAAVSKVVPATQAPTKRAAAKKVPTPEAATRKAPAKKAPVKKAPVKKLPRLSPPSLPPPRR